MSKKEHDTAAAEMRKQISTLEKPWYRASSELLEKHNIRNLRCLDLCCGNGEFSRILRDKHEMEVVCADYVPSHLEAVNDAGFITFEIDIDSDAHQVNEISSNHTEKFDLVVNLAAIEHVYNSDNLLRFAHAVLKPDGLLLVNTPNIAFAAYRFLSLFSGNRPFGEGHHIRFWDYRFLRTNLFLNGFSLLEDGRKFYSLPQDAMLRALRNRQRLASVFAWMFHSCRFLQHVPFFRGVCCDELTVLARKDNVPAIGFELNTVRQYLEQTQGSAERTSVILRLKEARSQGWLDEHLYLSKLVDELVV